MKKFTFPLEQALRWRQLQTDLQKSRVAAAVAVRSRLETELDALRDQARREHVLARNIETGAGLAAYAGFRERDRRAQEALEKQALAARKTEAAEMVRLREADRNARLLERLRERRLDDWGKQFDQELEAFAAEAFLCRHQARK
jgi:hypothetical protein